jgi:hypothetical protein
LFQNLIANIAKVQTLGGIVLSGGDFNARTTTLPYTINIIDLCELLQAPELARTEQPSIVAKRQNHDANIGGWGCELLDLCRDTGLFIFNRRTLGDESGEFICLANGGRSIVDYIVGSPIVWQVATHLEMIINDTHYYTMGGDFDHKPLHL